MSRDRYITLLPLHEQPGMVDAMATVVADTAGQVCTVCGLEFMGHTPESAWLGYPKHVWAPRPASPEDLLVARSLTTQAYENKRSA